MSAARPAPIATSVPMSSAAQTTARRTHTLVILTIITAIAVAVGLILSLVYAGTDVEQGHVQRIFYVHIASFFGAFSAFGTGVWGGIAYLRTRNPKWDTLALAGVEVGLALAVINLATGLIWARPIWNTWWRRRATSAATWTNTRSSWTSPRCRWSPPTSCSGRVSTSPTA